MTISAGTRMSPGDKCDTFQMDKFEQTAAAFVRDIFDRMPSGFWLSDESELDDFSFFGIPDKDYAALLRSGKHHLSWDDWAIDKIARTYGVQLTTTKILLTELFRQIEAHRQRQLH